MQRKRLPCLLRRLADVLGVGAFLGAYARLWQPTYSCQQSEYVLCRHAARACCIQGNPIGLTQRVATCTLLAP
eukprot:4910215-Lingulodinium_polyedra.AAC.1